MAAGSSNLRNAHLEGLDRAARRAEILRAKGNTDWQSWTPNWTNVTEGTGATNIGRWRWMNIEKTEAHIRVKLVFGTGGAVTGGVYCDTPPEMTAFTGTNFRSFGLAWYRDLSAAGAWTTGVVGTASGSDRIFFYNDVVQGVNINRPHTWASGDELSGDIILEVAKIY